MAKRRIALLITASCILWPFAANAQREPHPPCETSSPFPEFAPPGHMPNYRVWNSNEWIPPSCVGWRAQPSGVLVAIAGTFRFGGSKDDLLLRVGAISSLEGIRYWSVTENAFRPLITSAAALKGPDLNRPRGDFSLSEMKNGAELYFAETDNRLGEPVIYRMRTTQTDGTLVITVDNVSAVQKYMLPLVKPGDLQSIHYLAQAGPGLWTYYGLARTEEPPLAAFRAVRTESYINRSLAIYSHLTDAVVEPIRSYRPD